MNEETLKRPERPPEQQATHDKEMKELAELMMSVPFAEIHAKVAFCLADMVRAVVDGRLKPEDIPPTPDELLVISYDAVFNKLLDEKFKGMLSGLQ